MMEFIKIIVIFFVGYVCVVNLRNLEHNHAKNSAFALKYLPATNTTKDAFTAYFEAGMSAGESRRHHRELVEISSNCPEVQLADASRTPTSNQIYSWHALWRSQNLGRSASDVREVCLFISHPSLHT